MSKILPATAAPGRADARRLRFITCSRRVSRNTIFSSACGRICKSVFVTSRARLTGDDAWRARRDHDGRVGRCFNHDLSRSWRRQCCRDGSAKNDLVHEKDLTKASGEYPPVPYNSRRRSMVRTFLHKHCRKVIMRTEMPVFFHNIVTGVSRSFLNARNSARAIAPK